MKILPDGSFAIMVHPTKGAQCRCGKCGRKAPYYDRGRGRRLWRTCDWNNHKVYIIADAPRVCCKKHGVVTAAVPWARHGSRFTREFEALAAWLAMTCSKTAVASLLRISWNTVGPIISRMRSELDPNPSARLENLSKIGVDETSYKKGHKYITIVIDHDTGQGGLDPRWTREDRVHEVLPASDQGAACQNKAGVRGRCVDTGMHQPILPTGEALHRSLPCRAVGKRSAR